MDVDTTVRPGYYSLVRWVADPVRGEAKNVAVVLIDPETDYSGMRAIAPSQVSRALAAQGIFDAAVEGLRRQVLDLKADAHGLLKRLANEYHGSLQVTVPKRTAVTEPDETLGDLYVGLVHAVAGRGRQITKGKALDLVISRLRKQDFVVRRYEYVNDFRFDVVVTKGASSASVLEVLSFANAKADWTPEEYQMGHFLHALSETDLPGATAVFEPVSGATKITRDAYRRVARWCAAQGVPLIPADNVGDQIAGGIFSVR